MRYSLALAFFAASFLSFSIPKEALALSIKIGNASVNDLEDLFTSNGFDKPTIEFNETETTFDLSVIGGPVNKNGEFTSSFISDFWRGNLRFSQDDPTLSSDSLSASFQIFHQAGIDRPHEGDALKGLIYTDGATISAASTSNRTITKKGDGVVRHPAEHNDVYSWMLQADILNNDTIGDNISRWDFSLNGAHTVPTPALLPGLIGTCIAAIRKRRQESESEV